MPQITLTRAWKDGRWTVFYLSTDAAGNVTGPWRTKAAARLAAAGDVEAANAENGIDIGGHHET